MAWNISNILVNEAIANKKAGSGSDLTSRVTALEETVGDESSGLVKDVDDLETTVGDESSGLVKDVTDLKTGIFPLVFSTTATKIGKWGTDDLYAVVVDGGSMTGATLDIDYTLPQGATMHGLMGYGVTANAFIPLSFVNTSDSNYSISMYYDSTNSKIKIASAASQAGTSITVIVLYSQSANNRKRGK